MYLVYEKRFLVAALMEKMGVDRYGAFGRIGVLPVM